VDDEVGRVDRLRDGDDAAFAEVKKPTAASHADTESERVDTGPTGSPPDVPVITVTAARDCRRTIGPSVD